MNIRKSLENIFDQVRKGVTANTSVDGAYLAKYVLLLQLIISHG